jgi:hypothetical protein
MQGILISIGVSGSRLVRPRGGRPTEQWLRAGIDGGRAVLVPGFTTIKHEGRLRRCVVFCDDAGKERAMPINLAATKLWDEALRRNGHLGLFRPGKATADVLVGPVAIVVGDDDFLDAL